MIDDKFLEPEVRDGFYVPSEVKQAWAAELEVLQEIDRICKKHNIPYFADWGTLLGAVRHGGFIPWDDDLDITMKRADYDRFLQVAEKEMRNDYKIFTYSTHPDFWSFLARFVAKDRICFEEEHMNKFHGFPYIVGIDIFVLDYVCEDSQREKERCRLARYTIEAADAVAEGKLTGEQATSILDKLEHLLHIKLANRKDLHALRVKLYREAEKLFAMFDESESQELTRMMPNGLYGHGGMKLHKKYYENQVWLPFENTKIPVPSGYDEMLTKRYGDYMKLVRNAGGHDYPFFETQRKQLQDVLDFEMPGYRYKPAPSRDKQQGKQSSLKGMLVEAYEQLKKNVRQISYSYTDNNAEQIIQEQQILEDSQQLAIDMGTLIEHCKGEGHLTVSILEQFCEKIYELSLGGTAEQVQELESIMERLDESIREQLLEHRTVVFMPYKASQWIYMQDMWQAAMEDDKCDVYVIPIPYYYKAYDGALRDMQYEAEQFSQELHITAYDKFDFALQYPDTIIIQNPYDDADKVISVHRFFYSENLRKYTEQLVYIPPFVLEEYTENSYREYFNMKYYCTMPGVVNADTVVVQSEKMRQLYIKKLVEFAGEETKENWEEKLKVSELLYENVRKKELKKLKEQIPDEWKNLKSDKTKGQKKVLLYYTGVSGFMQYRDKMTEKIKESFEIFKENKDNILVLWKVQPLLKTTLEQVASDLYEQYCSLENQYIHESIGLKADVESDELLAEFADAYYGEASPLVQLCRNEGKPVMIQCID